jgi:GntR family transcriptional regulator/MocR family aminotransferase
VVIVSGVQEALALATRLLVGRGHRVVMEDPGYPGALRVFAAAGARVQFLPVDEAGMRVPDRRSAARLAYVTPAHQFPLGVSMSYVRRMALLQWAREAGALIVEDDYDSEYRYGSRPLPALQGLDASGTVLFTGSFNKLLFPSLRLGYMVVPPALVDPLAAVLSVSGHHRPMLDQATLCEFMAEGHLFRHLRRMRSIYAARRAALVEAADRELAGVVALSHSEAGLQAFARLLVPLPSVAVAEAAARDAVQVAPLSRYLQKPRAIDGLIMGFAAVDEGEITVGVTRLARTFERLLRRRR